MKNKNLAAMMSRVSEQADKLIIGELRAHGITGIVPSHGGILLRLFTGHRYTMKEMADSIHRTRPTLTVLVDKLVALGYVVKDKSPEDARVSYLSITPQGRELEPVFREISDKLNAVLYRRLNVTEAEVLQRQLRVMLEDFSELG